MYGESNPKIASCSNDLWVCVTVGHPSQSGRLPTGRHFRSEVLEHGAIEQAARHSVGLFRTEMEGQGPWARWLPMLVTHSDRPRSETPAGVVVKLSGKGTYSSSLTYV